MTTFSNIGGTSNQSFKIGLRGVTLYQGSSSPSFEANEGDIYFQTGSNPQVWVYGTSWTQSSQSYLKVDTALDNISIGDSSTKIDGINGKSTAIGFGSSAYSSGIAIGQNAIAKGVSNIAIGSTTDVNGPINAVGINGVLDTGLIAISGTSTGIQSISLGGTVTGDHSVVLGTNSTNYGSNSVVIGNDSTTNESNVVSIGSDSIKRRITNIADPTNNNDAVNLQYLNTALSKVSSSNNTPASIANLRITVDSVEIGSTNNSKTQDIVIGSGTETTGKSTTVGFAAVSGNSSVTLGNLAKSDNGSVSIGAGSYSDADSSIAIGGGYGGTTGASSSAAKINTGALNSIAIGSASVVNANITDAVAIGSYSVASENNTLSVGPGFSFSYPQNGQTINVEAYRRITNVADAINDHDAVTLEQAKSLVSSGSITNGGIATKDVGVTGAWTDSYNNVYGGRVVSQITGKSAYSYFQTQILNGQDSSATFGATNLKGEFRSWQFNTSNGSIQNSYGKTFATEDWVKSELTSTKLQILGISSGTPTIQCFTATGTGDSSYVTVTFPTAFATGTTPMIWIQIDNEEGSANIVPRYASLMVNSTGKEPAITNSNFVFQMVSNGSTNSTKPWTLQVLAIGEM